MGGNHSKPVQTGSVRGSNFALNVTDTSAATTAKACFPLPRRGQAMALKIVSFSYRRGAPPRGAAVVDCRALPNPHSVIALRYLDGRDPRVRQWLLVEGFGTWIKLCTAGTLLAEQGNLVACGCIAGQHRSVAVAEMIAEALRAGGREVQVEHTALW
jgi:UPF0042 nucleotide-binding protein